MLLLRGLPGGKGANFREGVGDLGGMLLFCEDGDPKLKLLSELERSEVLVAGDEADLLLVGEELPRSKSGCLDSTDELRRAFSSIPP